MAAESIGTLYPTNIPGYTDIADIQAALRLYHYGTYEYNTANTSTASLVANSIAGYLNEIQEDIVALEARPSSGGEVLNDAPIAGDFEPEGIPNGFVWVDGNGSLGGQPTSATSVFTNTAPTTSLTTGLIWIDKDAESSALDNPFIPSAIIAAKGDILAGIANDAISVLSVGTNGYFLKANSATDTGLQWAEVDLSSYLTTSSAASTYATKTTVEENQILAIMQAQ